MRQYMFIINILILLGGLYLIMVGYYDVYGNYDLKREKIRKGIYECKSNLLFTDDNNNTVNIALSSELNNSECVQLINSVIKEINSEIDKKSGLKLSSDKLYKKIEKKMKKVQNSQKAVNSNSTNSSKTPEVKKEVKKV